LEFSETSDQADWGYWYWATKNSEKLTYQSGADVDVRGAFQSNGKLANTKDTNFRPINQDYPVFGFSVDLGIVTGSVNTLYTIGLTQEQAIQFDGATGVVALASLWTSYFSSETEVVSRNSSTRNFIADLPSSHFSIMIIAQQQVLLLHSIIRSQPIPSPQVDKTT